MYANTHMNIRLASLEKRAKKIESVLDFFKKVFNKVINVPRNVFRKIGLFLDDLVSQLRSAIAYKRESYFNSLKETLSSRINTALDVGFLGGTPIQVEVASFNPQNPKNSVVYLVGDSKNLKLKNMASYLEDKTGDDKIAELFEGAYASWYEDHEDHLNFTLGKKKDKKIIKTILNAIRRVSKTLYRFLRFIWEMGAGAQIILYTCIYMAMSHYSLKDRLLMTGLTYTAFGSVEFVLNLFEKLIRRHKINNLALNN